MNWLVVVGAVAQCSLPTAVPLSSLPVNNGYVEVTQPVIATTSSINAYIRVTGSGFLFWPMTSSVTVKAWGMLVEAGGLITMGTPACPVQYPAVAAFVFIGDSTMPPLLSTNATLYGNSYLTPAGEGVPSYFGNKVIAVAAGGSFFAVGSHGRTTAETGSGTSWVRLASTAAEGSTRLVVDTPVDWVVGDTVVVTTSDFEPDHAELAVISAVDGTRTILDVTPVYSSTLRWDHNGNKVVAGGRIIDAVAEVGLLTRNVIIATDGAVLRDSQPDSVDYGGHTIVRAGAEDAVFSGVQFLGLGQAGRIGRYPVHFHLANNGDLSASYNVTDCSIAPSNTRWVSLHGVHGVNVLRNVGLWSRGHGIYLEDGVECLNRIEFNLGVLPRPAAVGGTAANTLTGVRWNERAVPPIISTDSMTPTVFWITNGANSIVGNVAAGTPYCGRGFWLLGAYRSPSVDDPALAYSATGTPGQQCAVGTQQPLGIFHGNSAHGSYMALDTEGIESRLGDCVGQQAALLGTQLMCRNGVPDRGVLTPCAMFQQVGSVNAQGIANNPNTIFPSVAPVAPYPTQGSGADVALPSVMSAFTAWRNRPELTTAAVWLRPLWWVVADSAFVDNWQISATTVSAGDPSGVQVGYYGVFLRCVFVGFSAPPSVDTTQWGDLDARGNGASQFNLYSGSYFPSAYATARNERRGLSIYDGPTHAEDCHFENFYETLQPAAGKQYVMPNVAVGWLTPNKFLVAHNHFVRCTFTSCGSRHNLYTEELLTANKQPTFGQILDSDRQTLIIDSDGTTTGLVSKPSLSSSSSVAGSPVYIVPNYPFHRGAIWTVECFSAVHPTLVAGPAGASYTSQVSPYRVVTVHVVTTPACDKCGNQLGLTSSVLWYNANNQQPFSPMNYSLIGQLTGSVGQSYMLAQVGGTYQSTFLMQAGEGAPPNVVVFSLREAAKGDVVTIRHCIGPGLSPASMLIEVGTLNRQGPGGGPPETIRGQARPNVNYGVLYSAFLPPSYTTSALSQAFLVRRSVDASTLYDPATGLLTLAVTVEDEEDTFCYPRQFCFRNSTGQCQLDPFAKSLLPECDLVDCDHICSAYAAANECPYPGCAGVRVTWTGSRDALPRAPYCPLTRVAFGGPARFLVPSNNAADTGSLAAATFDGNTPVNCTRCAEGLLEGVRVGACGTTRATTHAVLQAGVIQALPPLSVKAADSDGDGLTDAVCTMACPALPFTGNSVLSMCCVYQDGSRQFGRCQSILSACDSRRQGTVSVYVPVTACGPVTVFATVTNSFGTSPPSSSIPLNVGCRVDATTPVAPGAVTPFSLFPSARVPASSGGGKGSKKGLLGLLGLLGLIPLGLGLVACLVGVAALKKAKALDAENNKRAATFDIPPCAPAAVPTMMAPPMSPSVHLPVAAPFGATVGLDAFSTELARAGAFPVPMMTLPPVMPEWGGGFPMQ